MVWVIQLYYFSCRFGRDGANLNSEFVIICWWVYGRHLLVLFVSFCEFPFSFLIYRVSFVWFNLLVLACFCCRRYCVTMTKPCWIYRKCSRQSSSTEVEVKGIILFCRRYSVWNWSECDSLQTLWLNTLVTKFESIPKLPARKFKSSKSPQQFTQFQKIKFHVLHPSLNISRVCKFTSKKNIRFLIQTVLNTLNKQILLHS